MSMVEHSFVDVPDFLCRVQHYPSIGWIYRGQADIIKLHWFLFEYASELESDIKFDKKLRMRLMRCGVNDRAIADFCVSHAQMMKKQVLLRVSGNTTAVHFGYQEIEAYFPALGDELVDSLLTKAAEAWDSPLEKCEICSTRCISESDQRMPMFDDPF